MTYAAAVDDQSGRIVAAIAPLGAQEDDPAAGAARRSRFAAVWSAAKGLARSAFTKENAKNAATGAATMFVVKSAACAVAGACALPAFGVAASTALAGGAAAAGLSYWRETRSARREGREADAFWSVSNRHRMALAAGMSILGGSVVAAYQNGLFSPVTEKLAALVEKIPVRFSFFPAAHAAGFGDMTPGERELLQPPARASVSGQGATVGSSAPSSPALESSAAKGPVVAAPAETPAAGRAPAEAASVQKSVPEKAVEKAASPSTRPASAVAAPAEKPSLRVAETAPIRAGGSEALERARAFIKGNPRLEALAERATLNPQAEKDLAVELSRKNPALARALTESAAARGNFQAIRDLKWMERRNFGVSKAVAASASESAPAPAKPVVVKPTVASSPAAGPKAIFPSIPTGADLPNAIPAPAGGEAISCHVSGDMKKHLVVECTAPKGKDYILPGEHIGVTHAAYPDIRVEIANKGDLPLHSWRWAARKVYENVAGGLKDAFEKAAAYRVGGSEAVAKLAEKTQKVVEEPVSLVFGHNNR